MTSQSVPPIGLFCNEREWMDAVVMVWIVV